MMSLVRRVSICRAHPLSDMPQQSSEKTLIEKLKNGAALFCSLSLALLVSGAALRVLELLYFFGTHRIPADVLAVVFQALLFDALSFAELLPLLFVPFFLVYLGSRNAACRYRVYDALGTIVLVLSALLVKYFNTTLVPLGSDLFGYTPKEIAETAGGGATIDVMTILLLIVPPVLFWRTLTFVARRRPLPHAASLAVLGAGVILLASVSVLPARSVFTSQLSYDLALNKPAYFIKDSVSYLSRSLKDNSSSDSPSVFRSTTKQQAIRPTNNQQKTTGFTYVDPEYPFLRKDETPDVLGKFFTINSKRPPNIVFVLVEGLGAAFSGPRAYLGSFTPFLDELAKKSLFWENFLATQGRTFAALPSILASLPYASQGFSDLKQKMPRHLSLMSILKHNGYRLRFSIGSDPDFDDERLFLQKQGVDVIVGKDDYDGTYVVAPGTSWGYPDREVMRKALEGERRDSRQPYVSFVQTMSMHTSYSIPDQDLYRRRFEERMTALGFDEAKKERHREYRDIYATILYADDALRFFFEGYKKLSAYENTIFIVTGDHRLPEIEMSTKIDRFHVPLIIFSPLLKRPLQIESISSQLDITPSLLAFLRKNYGLDTPSLVTWVGAGLDTDPSFRNLHSYPLKHTKTNLIDYISGMYFLDQDVLFSIGKDMDLEPVADEKKKKELIAEFDRYKSMNDRFIRELKLMPDSLYERYHP